MNLAEKFNQRKENEKKEQEINRQLRVKNLANKIITTLSDKETIESIENYLLEYGTVSIKDFGCLCQGGFCDWQKGLSVLLQPLEDEWNEKGVRVYPSLSLEFRVNSSGVSYYDRKMTIEELKEWNKSKKQ